MAGTDPLDTFHAAFDAILVQRDVDVFMDLWAVDEDVTMWGSDLDERAVGRDQIRTLAEGIAGAQLTFTWDELRLHDAGDTAWVNAAGSVNGMPYRLTAVLVRRRAREWKWHTFNGSIPG